MNDIRTIALIAGVLLLLLVATAVGQVRLAVVPTPSCPYELQPQAAKVPSAHKAKLWRPPPAAPTTVRPSRMPSPAPALTGPGTHRSEVVPSPNCP